MSEVMEKSAEELALQLASALVPILQLGRVSGDGGGADDEAAAETSTYTVDREIRWGNYAAVFKAFRCSRKQLKAFVDSGWVKRHKHGDNERGRTLFCMEDIHNVYVKQSQGKKPVQVVPQRRLKKVGQ